MKTLTSLTVAAALAASLSAPAFADDDRCSVQSLAGRWIFATGIGRQMLGGPFPPDKDITAIGTMNIASDGGLEGKFDVTVEDTMFLPGVTYSGSVVLNADCTGTVTFVTSVGSVRTDSIALVSRREMLGMSQDTANLWTYQVRRIGGEGRED